MEATSPLVPLNGRNGAKDLGEYRKRALENAARHQFYQSDRVKQFHRELLLMETLNDRRLVAEQNRRIKDNTDEETRKFMAEIRRGETDALEQDRQRARRREVDRRAYAEELKQQMRRMEQARCQMVLNKQRELQECQELHRQHEEEKAELRRRDRQEKMGVRSVYLRQMAESRRHRDKENRAEALAEEWRRRWATEKDEWNRANGEKVADRLRRWQRRSQAVAETLRAQEQERALQNEEADACATARALAEQEARAGLQRRRREQQGRDMAAGIAAHRQHARSERQQRAEEERQSAARALGLNRAADAAHREGERSAAQARRDARSAIDHALRQQMAQKRQQEELHRQAELELDARNLELLAHEDAQFRAYADAIVMAAAASKRNTIPVRKAAVRGAGQGVGPIYGGLRAKYLQPGSNYIPEYVGSTGKDINRLFKAAADESSQGKLGFIW